MKNFSLSLIAWLAIFTQPILCAQADIAGRLVMLCDQFGITAEFIESDLQHLQSASDCECPSIVHTSNPPELAISEYWAHPTPWTVVLVTPSTDTYRKSLPRAPPAA